MVNNVKQLHMMRVLISVAIFFMPLGVIHHHHHHHRRRRLRILFLLNPVCLVHAVLTSCYVTRVKS